MSGVVQSVRNQPAINPRLLPAIDQLLIAGIKLGPRKKHDAINKILKLVPEWKRGDCWRHLQHPHAETCYCRGRGILLEASGQALGHYGGKCTEPDFHRPTETDGYVCN